MKGRPVIHNSDQALVKAQEIFWKKGYTATSLGDLLSATGMGSGSFYNTYKSGKKELFKKSIDQRWEEYNAFEKLLGLSEDPIKIIKEFFLSIADADQVSHLKGCFIVNTVIEMTGLDQDLQDQAMNMLKKVEQLYTDTIADAQKNGKLKNQTDPVVLGRYLVTLWSGINVTRRLYPDKQILLEQLELQLSVLK